MRIAVIGGGVSGLGAAWALKDTHEVVLFEKDRRLGGHAHTVAIEYDARAIEVDTGFIVFNPANYPNFVALLDHLDVPSQASDMSFSVSDPHGFEWASTGVTGLFAWKRNLTQPAFLAMLSDVVRFNARARADLKGERINGATLGEYVEGLRLGPAFLRNYLLPMGAAIWSTPERDMLSYPAESFVRFFDNHRLLHALRHPWRTVTGGSASYVARLAEALGARVRLDEGAARVERSPDGVEVRTQSGLIERFDQVVLACHSDQALALLGDASPYERAQLSAVRYAANTAYLHRDQALMPRRRAAWASWNYLRDRADRDAGACVTYWMNRLQTIDPERPLFVTLNPRQAPAEAATFARLTYDHPQFDKGALRAQQALNASNGANRTWFAGAWLGHGFHEDGLASGLQVAQRLGAPLPWRAAHETRSPMRPGALVTDAGIAPA